MNLYQAVQQIKYKLKLAIWQGTSNKLFADESVIVTVGPDQNAMWQKRFPLAMIRPGASVVDPTADEDPRFLQQTISVRIVQMVPGDDVGEMCMLGAHHPELQGVDEYTESQTTSSGKGLLQVEEVVLDTLKSLSPDDGVFMICRSKSGIDAVLDNEMGYVCWRDYSFEAQLTSERTFAPATNLKLSGGDLSWINPASRYDFRKMILRYNAGSSAPATIAAGTGGPAMDDDATTVSGSAGRAYALFAVYDDYHDTPSDDKDVSPAEVLIT